MVAGEASGDLLGSQLILALRELVPGLQVVGIGGPRMQSAGMDVWFPLEKLAVRGYFEVIKHFAEIVGIRRSLRRRLTANPPDLFIGIDAPDFNLDLECSLKARGMPTVHYVSPAIWMWRKERLRKIKRAVTRMLTLFPFEAEIYRQAGIDVAFVGHPLTDMLDQVPRDAAAREQLKLPPGVPVVALLPGSRQSELQYMADLFIQTANLIHARLPQARFLAPLATRETRGVVRNRAVSQRGGGPAADHHVRPRAGCDGGRRRRARRVGNRHARGGPAVQADGDHVPDAAGESLAAARARAICRITDCPIFWRAISWCRN